MECLKSFCWDIVSLSAQVGSLTARVETHLLNDLYSADEGVKVLQITLINYILQM